MRHGLLIKVAVLLTLVVLGVSAWWLYDLGKVNGVAELAALRLEHARLEKVYENLMTENASLREQSAIYARSSSIDRQAAQEVQDELGALQDKLSSSREEVEFYRGIVSPGDVKPGLYLHRFELTRGPQPGQFHYNLVLAQLKRNDHYLKGIVKWEITGELDGKQKQLGLAAVTEDKTDKLGFRFRYYQDLTGTVTLPEGFQAQQLKLIIRTTGKKTPEIIEKVIAWPAGGA